jgi:RHS repeat-associated protein
MYTYDSFGRLTGSTGAVVNAFRYTGREFDTETQIYNYRARYFDPSVGRFLSEDPINFQSGLNFYEYVANDPTTLIDPSGRTTCMKTVLGYVCWDHQAPGVNVLKPEGPKGGPGPSCQYQAFQNCVGNPWIPAGGPPGWTQFIPTKIDPFMRQSGPDFGANGPGMGPEPPPPFVPPAPSTQLDYGKVRNCISRYPLSPLGGNTYVPPGDVF